MLEYWWLIPVVIAVIALVVYSIYVFTQMPQSEQIQRILEWLLYAVAKAEKELGSGTGQIKLRYVYDMFIIKFPKLANKIAFDSFSLMVDTALDKFKNLLEENKALENYINEKGE